MEAPIDIKDLHTKLQDPNSDERKFIDKAVHEVDKVEDATLNFACGGNAEKAKQVKENIKNIDNLKNLTEEQLEQFSKKPNNKDFFDLLNNKDEIKKEVTLLSLSSYLETIEKVDLDPSKVLDNNIVFKIDRITPKEAKDPNEYFSKISIPDLNLVKEEEGNKNKNKQKQKQETFKPNEKEVYATMNKLVNINKKQVKPVAKKKDNAKINTNLEIKPSNNNFNSKDEEDLYKKYEIDTGLQPKTKINIEKQINPLYNIIPKNESLRTPINNTDPKQEIDKLLKRDPEQPLNRKTKINTKHKNVNKSKNKQQKINEEQTDDTENKEDNVQTNKKKRPEIKLWMWLLIPVIVGIILIISTKIQQSKFDKENPDYKKINNNESEIGNEKEEVLEK